MDALGLGFAPVGRDGLKTRLIKQGFTQGVLLQSGLLVQRESGDVVDRFRNRLMIPICRDSGSVVAFGGRSMESDQHPEVPELAGDADLLQGTHAVRAQPDASRRIRKLGFAVLVEGYFDFAQVFQAQAAPVVASCGTALTVQQAQLLRRFTTKVVLSYDPDAAGQGAAARSSELLVAEGSMSTSWSRSGRGSGHLHPAARRGSVPGTPAVARGPIWSICSIRRPRVWTLGNAERRREFLSRMLGVAARIPDAGSPRPVRRPYRAPGPDHRGRRSGGNSKGGGQQADRSNGERGAGARAAGTPAALKPAERGLIWGLFHRTAEAMQAIEDLDPEDFEPLGGREVFEAARALAWPCRQTSYLRSSCGV